MNDSGMPELGGRVLRYWQAAFPVAVNRPTLRVLAILYDSLVAPTDDLNGEVDYLLYGEVVEALYASGYAGPDLPVPDDARLADALIAQYGRDWAWIERHFDETRKRGRPRSFPGDLSEDDLMKAISLLAATCDTVRLRDVAAKVHSTPRTVQRAARQLGWTFRTMCRMAA